MMMHVIYIANVRILQILKLQNIVLVKVQINTRTCISLICKENLFWRTILLNVSNPETGAPFCAGRSNRCNFLVCAYAEQFLLSYTM
jgi:hypothetical protein